MTENDPFTSLSPIYHLDFDVLLEIFQTNTETNWTVTRFEILRSMRPSALDVLCRTSQVCRRWREITLSSPFLWGNVIELDMLRQKDSHWRMEVLRRTGKSLLSIGGSVGDDRGSTSFFVELLHSHWSRIRRLEFYVGIGSHKMQPGVWDIFFLKPAPALEIFIPFTNNRPEHTISHEEGGPIFANHAPFLREFAWHGPPLNHIFFQASFLRRLRRLDVSMQSNPIQVLNALSTMHSLEHLQLRKTGRLDTLGDGRTVSLPLLHTIGLEIEFMASLFLLKYIIPSIGSTLDLCMDIGNNVSDREIDEMCKIIYRYVRDYLVFDPSSSDTASLQLAYSAQDFDFGVSKYRIGSGNLVRYSDFSVNIIGDNSLRGSVIPKFLAALASCQYTHVTTYKFIPDEGHVFENAQLNSVALSLSTPSVKVPTTTEDGLEVLSEAEKTTSNILPLLHSLEYTVLEDRYTTNSFPELLLKFLQGRLAADRLITTLDISGSNDQESLDWGCLEAVAGLKVILQYEPDIEYICGSGTPEKLNLSNGNASVN